MKRYPLVDLLNYGSPTQISYKLPQIYHFELSCQFHLQLGDFLFWVTCDDQVINIKHDNQNFPFMSLIVKIWIYSTFNHVQIFEKTINFFIPSFRKLSKPIKCFVKLTTQMFLPNLYKSFELHQVYLFLNITIWKLCFHIHLWNFPPKMCNKSHTNMIVFHLMTGTNVSWKSKPSFYSNPLAINLALYFEDLLLKSFLTLYRSI